MNLQTFHDEVTTAIATNDVATLDEALRRLPTAGWWFRWRARPLLEQACDACEVCFTDGEQRIRDVLPRKRRDSRVDQRVGRLWSTLRKAYDGFGRSTERTPWTLTEMSVALVNTVLSLLQRPPLPDERWFSGPGRWLGSGSQDDRQHLLNNVQRFVMFGMTPAASNGYRAWQRALAQGWCWLHRERLAAMLALAVNDQHHKNVAMLAPYAPSHGTKIYELLNNTDSLALALGNPVQNQDLVLLVLPAFRRQIVRLVHVYAVAQEQQWSDVVAMVGPWIQAAKRDRPDREGQCGLDVALNRGNRTLIDMLLPKHRRLSHAQRTTLYFQAAQHGWLDVMQMLVEGSRRCGKVRLDVRELQGRGETSQDLEFDEHPNVLMVAAVAGHIGCVAYLLDRDSVLAKRLDKQGRNALLHALNNDRMPVAKLLIPFSDVQRTFDVALSMATYSEEHWPTLDRFASEDLLPERLAEEWARFPDSMKDEFPRWRLVEERRALSRVAHGMTAGSAPLKERARL